MKVSLMIKKFPFVYEAERSSGDFSDYFPTVDTVDTVDYPVRDSHFDLEIASQVVTSLEQLQCLIHL